MEPIIVNGKYGEAKIFADIMEPAAIPQVIQMLNQPYAAGEQVRMMPDIHPGAGCTIGTTMTIHNKKICPNLVGVDIGCAMYVVKLAEKNMDLAMLDTVIRQNIPSGMSVRTSIHPMAEKFPLQDMHCRNALDTEYARLSLGSLGGGNHFIGATRS